jgi:hypothetical protein
MNITVGRHTDESTGAENDRIAQQDTSPGRLGDGFRGFSLRARGALTSTARQNLIALAGLR